MFKTLIILVIAFIVGCIGHAFLSVGMKGIAVAQGEFSFTEYKKWFPFFWAVLTCPKIVFGVFLQAIFFGLWLVALSRADLSFVLPLSAMEYLIGAVIAYYVLAEKITWMRLSGTLIICMGIFLICLDQLHFEKKSQASIQEQMEENHKQEQKTTGSKW